MKVLALGQNHDSNACLCDTETGWFRYIKSERISGNKHTISIDEIAKVIVEEKFLFEHIILCWGDFYGYNLYDKNVSAFYDKRKEFDNLVLEYFETGFSDCQEDLQPEYIQRLRKRNQDTRRYIERTLNSLIKQVSAGLSNFNYNKITAEWVHHHYAHSLSGWILDKENFKDIQYSVSIDGRAFDGITVQILKNTFNLKEVEILFANRNVILDENNKITDIKNSSFGGCWQYIGSKFGFTGMKLDFAGKLMGLNAYGEVNKDVVSKFKDYEWNMNNLSPLFRDISEDTFFQNYTKRPVPPKIINTVATFNQIWSDTIMYLFKKYIPKNAKVIFSGGCAQNTLLNYHLKKEFPNLIVVPHCYDGGLSLGSLAYFLIKNNLPFPAVNNYPYIQTDIKPETTPSLDTIKEVAKLLSEDKIVGWYQGHGECGPRALGNRSILMNAGIKFGKRKINRRIKHREYWRPFAPSVIKEEASKWFDIDDSKYMMYAAKVLEDKKELIPSVTHKDGTSRVQTVSRDDNEPFYDLLTEFNKLTNIPLLLNTSLNDNGHPIVGSPKAALEFFRKSKLHAICIGDKIYKKKCPGSSAG